MHLIFFSAAGWEGWDLDRRPLIRQGTPVLVDDDLRLEDEQGPRASVTVNQWLRELPVSGRVTLYVAGGQDHGRDPGGEPVGLYLELDLKRGIEGRPAPHGACGDRQVPVVPSSGFHRLPSRSLLPWTNVLILVADATAPRRRAL